MTTMQFISIFAIMISTLRGTLPAEDLLSSSGLEYVKLRNKDITAAESGGWKGRVCLKANEVKLKHPDFTARIRSYEHGRSLGYRDPMRLITALRQEHDGIGKILSAEILLFNTVNLDGGNSRYRYSLLDMAMEALVVSNGFSGGDSSKYLEELYLTGHADMVLSWIEHQIRIGNLDRIRNIFMWADNLALNIGHDIYANRRLNEFKDERYDDKEGIMHKIAKIYFEKLYTQRHIFTVSLEYPRVDGEDGGGRGEESGLAFILGAVEGISSNWQVIIDTESKMEKLGVRLPSIIETLDVIKVKLEQTGSHEDVITKVITLRDDIAAGIGSDDGE